MVYKIRIEMVYLVLVQKQRCFYHMNYHKTRWNQIEVASYFLRTNQSYCRNDQKIGMTQTDTALVVLCLNHNWCYDLSFHKIQIEKASFFAGLN